MNNKTINTDINFNAGSSLSAQHKIDHSVKNQDFYYCYHPPDHRYFPVSDKVSTEGAPQIIAIFSRLL
jgi:hypothetical protein